MKTKNLSHRILAMTILWAMCVCAGVIFFAWYDVRSLQESAAPHVLPTTAQILSTTTTPTVAMFLHPRCACSHASLAEFAKLIHEFSKHVRFRIVFFKPAREQLSWVEKDNLFAKSHALASRYNSVHVSIDEDGKESERFHAETSGFVVAYDAAGTLLYNGGITGSRGHEGDNAGEAVLRTILSKKFSSSESQHLSVVQAAAAPTFGCAIRGKQ